MAEVINQYSELQLKDEYVSNDEDQPDSKDASTYFGSMKWKCGEIILMASCKLWFVCAFCDDRFHNSDSFEDHIQQVHIAYTEEHLQNNDPLHFPQTEKEPLRKVDVDGTPDGCNSSDGGINCIPVEQTFKEDETSLTDDDTPIECIQMLEIVNASEAEIDELKFTSLIEETESTRSQEDFELNESTCSQEDLEQKEFTSRQEDLEQTQYTQQDDSECYNSKSEIKDAECENDENLSKPRKFRKKVFRPKKVYACSFCPHIAKDARFLEVHQRKQHGTEKQNQCEECGKCFTKKSYLKAHSILHTGQRPYKCQLCKATFAHPNSLHGHMAIHQPKRVYKCEYCEKTFISHNGLKYHTRDHTGNKPHTCLICNRGFASKSHYNRHMVGHTGQENYICTQCGMSFKYRDGLIKHMVYHNGAEKKFRCDVCDRKFLHRKNLIQHVKIHSDVRQYTCKVCGKTFAQFPGLYSHMKYHNKHEEEGDDK